MKSYRPEPTVCVYFYTEIVYFHNCFLLAILRSKVKYQVLFGTEFWTEPHLFIYFIVVELLPLLKSYFLTYFRKGAENEQRRVLDAWGLVSKAPVSLRTHQMFQLEEKGKLSSSCFSQPIQTGYCGIHKSLWIKSNMHKIRLPLW